LPAKAAFASLGYSAMTRGALNSLLGMMHAQRTLGETDQAGIGVRIAVYPSGGTPEITEVSAANPGSATQKFTRFVTEKAREAGGGVPEEAIREVVENLIHAGYRGVVISVLEEGNVVRVSDKGPGVENKSRAMEFGFSGAAPETLGEIRGVGAGLGIARAAAEKVGGTVTIEDNIGGGTVATVSVAGDERVVEEREASEPPRQRRYPDGVPRMNISERQQKALITVLECGEVGPSTVADRLEISVSTAYRDLSVLEEHGLVMADESGKRLISPLGRDLVEAIINDWVK
jgi:anti-sigma regulatory factor (Ser/Thr protein kinase)/DNA-binding transcriptional ArsR family regulator